MAKIFISYAREDYTVAKRLYDFLMAEGHEAWLDKENLLPGQKWESAIETAIRECHFFIALLSPSSVEKRGYVQKELRVGLDILDQIPDSQVFLIPARIGECEPKHDRLRELQRVDLFSDWDDGLRRLNKVFSFVPEKILMSNLAGTRWSKTQRVAPRKEIVLFQKDGSIKYIKPGGDLRVGTWKQSGSVIYMEFNSNYAQFKGIIEGNSITGEAQNIEGDEWRWEAMRIE